MTANPDLPDPFEQPTKRETEKDSVRRLLNEAMSGTSSQSKNSLISEAIKCLS